MKNNPKKSLLTMAVALIFSLSFTACGTTKTKTQTPNTTPKQESNVKNQGIEGNTVPSDNKTMERSKKVEEEVNKVKGVKSSTVLITEKRALVGVNIDANVQGKMTDELKSNVEKAVKKADSTIETVAVSADPDILQRIADVGKGITSGKPFSEFGTEVEEIFKRIIPSK